MATPLRATAAPARISPPAEPTTPANRIGSFLNRPRAARPRGAARNRFRLGLEAMEGRTLMSNIPVYQTINAPYAQGVTIPTEPMQQTVVDGTYAPNTWWSTPDQVQLTAGELVTVSARASTTYGSSTPDGLYVAAPDGSWVAAPFTASTGQAIDPETGAPTWDSSAVFRAPTTGTYNLAVWHAPDGTASDAYALTVRPITLDSSTLAPDQNATDAAKLAFTGGGLYAFLNASDTILTLDGPTGRGFQIEGQFQEAVTPIPGTGLSTATITATSSSITLDSALGPITVPLLPGTSFTVTTRANGYNGAFGEVASAALSFAGESIIQDIVSPLSGSAGLDLSGLGVTTSTPGVQFGIALGDDPAVGGNGAPVNPAVPYLYLSVNTGFSASFGKVQASALAKGASVVVDPADPSIFVDVQGLPGVSDLNFGLSEHGYIAFTPAQDPNHWGNQALYGDVYYGGTLDIADLTENAVPVFISGEAVINFDTNGGPWTSGVAQKVKDLFAGTATLSELESEAYGINGTAGLSFGAPGGSGLSATLQAATLIINGPAQTIDFRGGSVNPFAGTPLAFLDTNANGATLGFTEDGYLNFGNGQFDGTLYGNFTLDQIGLSGSLEVSNSGVTARGSFNNGFLSGSVTGSIYWDGEFYLGGTATVGASGDINIPYLADVYGGVSGTVNVALYDDGTAGIWGDAEVYGSAYVGGVYVGGIDQEAYFNYTTTNLGQSVTSLFNEAANAIDGAVNSLYNDWLQAEAAAEAAWQQVQDGWNWFWGGSWL